jgi:hypothetical protein
VFMKKYILLWVLCVIGSWAITPYLWYLGFFPPEMDLTQLLWMRFAQTMIFYSVICWVAYVVVPKTDLRPFEVRDLWHQIAIPGICWGLVLGLMLFLANVLLFKTEMIGKGMPPLWARGLASIYGGVNEEVILRLFLFSLVYWGMGKFLRMRRRYLLWTVNLVVAVIFAGGHLPLAFSIAVPTYLQIVRIILLNAAAGLALGFVYWNQGIWATILAHFIADLMIHVVLI